MNRIYPICEALEMTGLAAMVINSKNLNRNDGFGTSKEVAAVMTLLGASSVLVPDCYIENNERSVKLMLAMLQADLEKGVGRFATDHNTNSTKFKVVLYGITAKCKFA